MTRAAQLTLLILSLALPSLARAGGYAYPDQGTVAMGRGGAFAAKADDGTAIYYNPAGLAEQQGWNVMVDTTAGFQNTSFQRTNADGSLVGPSVSNGPGPFFVPFITVSRGFDLGLAGKLTLAVGLWGPAANGSLSFPDETPPALTSGQRLTFVSMCGLAAPAPAGCPGASTNSLNTAPQAFQFVNDNILIVYPTIAVAYAPLPMLSVGGSLQLIYANTTFRRSTYDGSQSEQAAQGGGSWTHMPSNEQLSYDTMANVAVSGATLSGNVGIKFKPLPFLTLGASYRPNAAFTQSGTLKLDFSPLAQATQDQVTGPGTSNSPDGLHGQGPTTLSNTFPGELKTGLSYDFGSGDIEADFHYTQWSAYTEALLTPSFSQKNDTSPTASAVPPVHLTRNLQNTWSVRLGSDVRVPVPGVRLTVRAGVGYESDPYNPNAANQYVTVDYANFDQYWGSVGASVGLGSFDLDVAYSHVYQPEHDVRNSGTVAVQNNPTKPAEPIVVGNGNYSTAYDLVALGGRIRF